MYAEYYLESLFVYIKNHFISANCFGVVKPEDNWVRGLCCLRSSVNRPTQEVDHRISVYYQSTGGVGRQRVSTSKNCRNLLNRLGVFKEKSGVPPVAMWYFQGSVWNLPSATWFSGGVSNPGTTMGIALKNSRPLRLWPVSPRVFIISFRVFSKMKLGGTGHSELKPQGDDLLLSYR